MATRRRRNRPVAAGEPDPAVIKLVEKAASKGLTPFALCRLMAVHPSVLNRWRSGTSSPTMSKLRPYYDFVESYRP